MLIVLLQLTASGYPFHCFYREIHLFFLIHPSLIRFFPRNDFFLQIHKKMCRNIHLIYICMHNHSIKIKYNLCSNIHSCKKYKKA